MRVLQLVVDVIDLSLEIVPVERHWLLFVRVNAWINGNFGWLYKELGNAIRMVGTFGSCERAIEV